MAVTDEGGDLPRADPRGLPSGVPALVDGAFGGCDMRLPAGRPGPSGAARRSRRAFTLLELLVVIAIIGILVGLLMPGPLQARRVAKNGVAQSTLRQLETALRMYEADYGVCPNEGGPLRADTTVFVKCLGSRGPKGGVYYDFKDALNDKGEFLSVIGEPYRYTWPGNDRPGPDGFFHPGAEYLLWTTGCVQDDPERQWEINSWTTR